MDKPLCQKCGKPHEHYHIHFFGGHKVFRLCYECCDHPGCIDGRKRGLKDKGGFLE